ncbi:MAG TPA: hypothetical protein VG297_16250 [Bryobacteraceae bacterium]|nr:hypothetical protein [Bryobacteraceae bacterium]
MRAAHAPENEAAENLPSLFRILFPAATRGIEARSGDTGALALANRTAAEISTLPLRKTGVAWGGATVYADMGRVYVQLGEKKSAGYWLQKSAVVGAR